MDRGLDENYQDLANAVILQALNDYRYCLAGIPLKDSRNTTLKSLEAFFNSEWFKMLTNVDKDLIIDQVRKECGRL